MMIVAIFWLLSIMLVIECLARMPLVGDEPAASGDCQDPADP
jgi:hypothetical protein